MLVPRVPKIAAIGLLLCASLLPSDVDASPILPSTSLGSLTNGIYELGSDDPAAPTSFATDNNIALFYFSLGFEATITATITSAAASPAGFDPILTLFDSGTQFLGKWDWYTEATSVPLVAGPLPAGTYLLALTQRNNYFSGEVPGGFDYDLLDPLLTQGLFTASLYDPERTLGCSSFIAQGATTADPPECRSSAYFGTLAVEATVPEPATLSLLTVGAVLLSQRRIRQKRSGNSPTRPSL